MLAARPGDFQVFFDAFMVVAFRAEVMDGTVSVVRLSAYAVSFRIAKYRVTRSASSVKMTQHCDRQSHHAGAGATEAAIRPTMLFGCPQ